MTDEVIQISAEDLAFVNDILASGTNIYQAYDRMLPYLEEGTDQYFWFQQASIINQQATGYYPPSNNNLSSTYIIAHSAYGLALDGHSIDLGNTSNAIGTAVLNDILSSGGIIPLDQMIQYDIAQALNAGNQTIGGWGGAFYYWNVEHNGSTVGQSILNNPQDLEKFLLSSTAATLAVISQELGEGPSLSEIITVINTAAGAGLPYELKEEIGFMVYDALLTGRIASNSTNFGQWTYDPSADEFYYIIPEGAVGAGQRVVASGQEASDLQERLLYRTSLDQKGLDSIADTFIELGLAQYIPPDQQCFLLGTIITMADGSKKPIEQIRPDDWVLSMDQKTGQMVPGKVTRTFQNEVKIVLGFHGTFVTPGHVYYRPDSKRTSKFEPLIDVLRDDGVIQRQDGTLIRAATNVPVDSPRDGFVHAVAGQWKTDGTFQQTDEGLIRLGTRFLVGDGDDRKSFAVADLIEHNGGVVGEDKMIHVGGNPSVPFVWDLGDTLPKPEDYVLACSGTTLEDIYKAAEWESQVPRLPAPMALDRGPVQPLKGAALSVMPRNEPLNVAQGELTVAKPQQMPSTNIARG